MTPDPLMSAKKIAAYLDVSESHVWHTIVPRIRHAEIRIGPRTPRWRRSTIDEYLAAHAPSE